jgi:hypothetical protein
MGRLPALPLFSLGFSFGYFLAYCFEWAPFLYYPQVGRFSWVVQPEGAGPAMLWFGSVAIGIIFGCLAMLVPSNQGVSHAWLAWAWLVPCPLLIYIIVHESHWFF